MDLAAFYGAYRQDGHGRAAFDPAVMVAVLLYAYARGIRSSRAIERACEEDVAFRVLAAHQVPDHTTIARFRQRHQNALARLFGEVLALCADAGPVCADVLAVDGTKIHANASERASCDYERLAREVLADADAIDAAEDERFGDQRGDELPEPLGTRQGRAKWLADAKRRLEERRAHEARAMQALAADGIMVLIPPDAKKRQGTRPGWNGGLYAFMRRRAGHAGRRRALPATLQHDRAGLRRHQVQPQDRPLPTPRQSRLPLGMAAHHRHSQPPQAPPAPARGRRRNLTSEGGAPRAMASGDPAMHPPLSLPRPFRNSHHAERPR
jgi:transposase